MKALGDAAEQRALRFLESRGLTLVERNWRCRGGELDLILREGPVWVFVEVRHRSHAQYGGAAESITPTKCRRLMLAAELYLARHGIDAPCRFDAVLTGPDGMPVWLKNILG
ncbi:YraN family protein [Gulbenkiania mobilis]|uniref:YraN family protein n=1 Tax=Gulbenkiania mobilis TaxID=397457 RepID=UPI0006BBD16C|nr:YraN family protein [Gulbenkiania mobilis]